MSKPVVFVPGYPGSHLHDRASGEKLFLTPGLLLPSRRREILARLEPGDDLTSPDPIRAGEPIRRFARLLFFDLAKQAESLYDLLDDLGVPIAKFGWDWRRPIWDPGTQDALAATIAAHATAHGAPVTLIAHSTGGLVVRRLLERRAGEPGFLDRIERLIAFGVPWAGTLKSFVFLNGQESFGPIPAREVQRLVALTWAGYDLLPPDPARTDLTDASGRALDLAVDASGAQVGLLTSSCRGWLEPTLAARMALRADAADRELGRRAPAFELGGRTIPVTNVVGFGERTTICAEVGPSGAFGQLLSNAGDATLDGGDGTVPRVSAAWLRGPGIATYHLPVGMDHLARLSPHSLLWRNPGGRNLLRALLTDAPLEPFVYAAVDSDDFASSASVRVRAVALDRHGAPLPAARARAVGLTTGDQPFSSFAPERDGRHLIRVPRAEIRPVNASSHDRFRRLTVEIAWDDGGYGLSPLRRSLALRF